MQIIRFLALAIIAFIGSNAECRIITLSFSGTYQMLNESHGFGLSGENIPYNYSLTYDTALDTNPYEFTSGTIGDFSTPHNWYGYSASGIVAARFTLGTYTWDVGDIIPRAIDLEAPADLWLNTDIAVETPNLVWISIDGARELNIGSAQVNFGESMSITLDPFSAIYGESGLFDAIVSDNLVIAAVPEPSSFSLITGAFILGFCFVIRTVRNTDLTNSKCSVR